MNTPNFFLEKKRFDQTAEGKAVRKELQRRKQVGFYISCVEETAEFDERKSAIDETNSIALGVNWASRVALFH